MLRPLAMLVGLVVLALLALFFLRSRETPPALADAPVVSQAAASTLENASAPAASLELQPGETAVVTAPTGSARVHGHLLFEDTRRPIAGARIVFRYIEPTLLSKPAQELTAAEREAQQKTLLVDTDSDGSYSAQFSDGVLLCEARVMEREPTASSELLSRVYVDAFVSTTRDLQLRVLHGEFELDLFVGGGTSLRGLVLQRGDLTPIAGAEVTIVNSDEKAFRATSGPDGRFTLRGITFKSRQSWAGRMTRLTATHPDFVRAECVLPALDTDGHWADPTLLLVRGVTVGGIVVDAAGVPVGGLELALRPLHGSAQGEQCEFEGEWNTKSDESGIFLFPRIPAFDRAWLVTGRHSVGVLKWHGASRTLLHGRDPYLPSLELRLRLEVGVEVRALYPDGTQARSEDLLLLREDEDGKLRSTGDQSRILCASGRATRIVAWCKPRADDEEGVVYRGEAVVAVSGSDPHPRAEVQLARETIQHKQREPTQLQFGIGAGTWTNSTLLLHFVDRASGLPLPETALMRIEHHNGRAVSQVGTTARIRLACEPGWVMLKVTVEGYRPCTIEFEVKDNEAQAQTVALDRVSGG